MIYLANIAIPSPTKTAPKIPKGNNKVIDFVNNKERTTKNNPKTKIAVASNYSRILC